MVDMSVAEIDTMLSEARIGRLCMANGDGRPYAIPLPFCWHNQSIYVRLALTGRKGDILSQNNHVCFEVDHFTDSLDSYASVLIEGQMVPVEDLGEKSSVKRNNDEKYDRLRGGFRPGHGRNVSLQDLPMRKIIVEQIAGRMKESPTRMATSAVIS